MHPTVCEVGPFTLSSYGLLMAVAFVTATWLSARVARELRDDVPMTDAMVMDWACWAVIGGILGGRLLYIAQHWRIYLDEPWEVIALWHGGLIWYGGFFGGLAASAIYWRRHRVPVLRGVDQVIPFVALGHAIGRIGCFLNGCCLGVPSDAWWAVQFPGMPEPVVAIQLIEAAGLTALFVALRLLQRPSVLRRPGRLFGWYLIGYAILRWGVEQWRDMQPVVWQGWTLHQVISALLLLIGVWLVTSRDPRVPPSVR
jgi:phosphatidylglycerol:prolipoprotein diacylglycerol transferase